MAGGGGRWRAVAEHNCGWGKRDELCAERSVQEMGSCAEKAGLFWGPGRRAHLLAEEGEWRRSRCAFALIDDKTKPAIRRER